MESQAPKNSQVVASIWLPLDLRSLCTAVPGIRHPAVIRPLTWKMAKAMYMWGIRMFLIREKPLEGRRNGHPPRSAVFLYGSCRTQPHSTLSILNALDGTLTVTMTILGICDVVFLIHHRTPTAVTQDCKTKVIVGPAWSKGVYFLGLDAISGVSLSH